MRSRVLGLAIVSTLFALVAATPAAGAASNTARERLDVYSGEIGADKVARITALGVDRHELRLSRVRAKRGVRAMVRVEAILSGRQVEQLRRQGVDLQAERDGGLTTAQRATAEAADGHEVFRKYSGPGGLKAEFEQTAREHPLITKLVNYGKTVRGQDIVALKVTANARRTGDGAKPAVVYLGAQHAREWITPEMIRRLMHHIVDGYTGGDAEIRRIVNATELWFVPVANPDGYDWSFEDGQRLWRKNLRDTDGNGQINAGDGVDLNRNFPEKWGYDNEGSSPSPSSETYRGPSPGSEPETQGIDKLVGRVRHEFFVNYHSAAELLLYGIGWQVATPSPDDLLYETMAGDDAHPAIPGYDPDISAELYTTNGDTDFHMQERYGTLGFTPEMATCEAASDSVPDDEFEAKDCGSGFEFPDDEALVQAEFEKNIPFALSVAKSADDPDDPESVVGRKAPDFRVDSFEVSYGDPQTIAVVAKRELRAVRLRYRINGGRERNAPVTTWAGGERYGDEGDDYYTELRGVVRDARPGDRVEAWFTGTGAPLRRQTASEHFTYRVAQDTGARVLVLANEDYTGVNPTYPAGTNAPKYAAQRVAAVEAAGYDADVWDVDAQGVPHDLGVLSHYDAVVWYLGDNRLTQDPEDEIVESPFGGLPDMAVAERQQYLTIAVRDYLNEGGKLIHDGETAQYQGLPGFAEFIGGVYYGLNGDPSAECVITTDFRGDCLLLADDFRQYYLGAFARVDVSHPSGVKGIDDPIDGFEGELGGPVVDGDNPLDEAGAFRPTSEVLPVSEFPQFASRAAADYGLENDPYKPVEGQRYAGAVHADNSYMRLTKTVDLTSATSAELRFQLSYNTERSYDNVIVEAHTVGQDDWTTLPDLNGATSTDPPAECAAGFLIETHPFLTHYLGGEDCTEPGSSGTWNAFTGSSDGWQEVAFDLSAFAGKQVELSISYVTDEISGGVGAFVDDTRVIIDGSVASADGFEGATSTWSVPGEPEGSPPNTGDWQIGGPLVQLVAGTATQDTLLLGFGLEQLATDAERVDLVKRALGGLIGAGGT